MSLILQTMPQNAQSKYRRLKLKPTTNSLYFILPNMPMESERKRTLELIQVSDNGKGNIIPLLPHARIIVQKIFKWNRSRARLS